MQGLFKKYHITKSDGSPCDPDAQYFVLRVDTDEAAREAVLAYADAIEDQNYVLAMDLRLWVQSLEERSQPCKL